MVSGYWGERLFLFVLGLTLAIPRAVAASTDEGRRALGPVPWAMHAARVVSRAAWPRHR